MELRKLTLNNFFRYYKKQEIEFSTDKEKNITVINGENGYGKTTLIGAFTWCFYGILEDPLQVDEMYNSASLAEDIQKNKTRSKSYVEVLINYDNKEYSIYREQNFLIQDDIARPFKSPIVKVSYTNSIGEYVQVTDPEGFMNKIIPSNLKQFFFFDGENIDRLAQKEGRGEIKDAILSLLGLNILELTEKDLKTVENHLESEFAEYQPVDIKDRFKEREKIKYDISELEGELDSVNIDILTSNEKIDRIEKDLQEHNSDKLQEYIKESKENNKKIKNLKESSKLVSQDINLYISKYAHILLLENQFKYIYNLLEDRKEKGELPSDIKGKFIEDLINRKLCICGNSVVPGSKEYENLLKLKKNSGKQELDSAYYSLTSFIDKNKNITEKFYKSYTDKIANKESYERFIEELENRNNKIEEAIHNFDSEEVRIKQSSRRELREMNKNYQKKAIILETKIDSRNKELEEINAELKNLEIKSNKARKISDKINLVKRLKFLNSLVNESLKDKVRAELDKEIKEVFAIIAHKKYRVPLLTDNLELKIISTRGFKENDEVILSTGENQIASLSFIGALVSYSRKKQNSKLSSTFMGGDFPIVADSPFGNLDDEHTAQISRTIGLLARQVIIIVSQKQWRDTVEDNVVPRLGKMYQLNEGKLGEGINRGEYTYVEEILNANKKIDY